MIARLEHQYGLDKPWYERYVIYVKNALQGDFGESYSYRPQQVSDIIARTLPTSLWLGTMATMFAVTFGMTLGVLAAVNQNGDHRLHHGHDLDSLLQHAQLRDGVRADPAIRGLVTRTTASISGSDLRAGTVAEGLDPAHHRARRGAAGDHRAIHALEHDRRHPVRLRAYRARQGTGRSRRSSSSTCSRTR